MTGFLLYFLFALVCAAEDACARRIRFITVALGTGVGLLYSAFSARSVLQIAAAALPGIFFLAAAVLFPGNIGWGDVIYHFIAALFLTPSESCGICILSLFLSAAGGLALIWQQRGTRKERLTMPYLVFPVPAAVLLFLFRL